jgi:hypothetical protein
MSTPYTPMADEHGGRMLYEYDDDHGQGLVTFAGIMLMIAAVLNLLYGIAAIDSANFFTQNARYVFGDLNTWGWFVVSLGAIQFFAAFAIWRGAAWGRWFGVACACVNAIVQMLWLPSSHVLGLTIMALDIIAVYGLVAYGGRRRAANEARARSAG